MAGSLLPAEVLAVQPDIRNFTVVSQQLDLEVNLREQSLQGFTSIQLVPLSKSLRQIRLHCRQCKLGRISVESETANYSYKDPFDRLQPQPSYGVHQHHLYRSRFAPQFKDPPDEELVIRIPNKVQVKELSPFAVSQSQDAFNRSTKSTGNASAGLETPAVATAVEQNAAFAPLNVKIEFEIRHFREGLQFVGLSNGDSRYPHLFTQNSPFTGIACCLFPCVDDLQSRCIWEIRIKSPRTLGDALNSRSNGKPSTNSNGDTSAPREAVELEAMDIDAEDSLDLTLSEEEQTLDMQVICSGEMADEIIDPSDARKKITSFNCSAAVSPNQVGFAVGPFETVDLSDFREVDEDEKLGSEAVQVQALCLPGRVDEVRNTAMPIAKAVDYFTGNFTTFPFSSFQLCFVDDLLADTCTTAGFSFCSTRLLFPDDIIDPIYDTTRKLVHTLACQYAGISIAPKDPSDSWCIVGMAYFLTDLFLKHLCGNNEYRYQQKLAADKVLELDFERPPLHSLGSTLHLDPSEAEFLALKASVVFFILDRRLTKGSGSTGMARIISRSITNAKAGDAETTLLSTGQFQRTCEKLGHSRLDAFFQQWVYGAGCPHFMISQRFNKKKLVVEMQIIQIQGDADKQQRNRELNPDNFLRDVSEDTNEIYAGNVQNVFTGPMTIRIHEADGTPYEHIVEIKEANTKFEIPYNTKYKRLKRSRRQKERTTAAPSADAAPEVNDDVLLYCLGDILQSEEEVEEWRLHDWPKEEEDKMSQESYEWIRMDADFEWICKMNINMPAYMYISQLQQDRDVVAQLESLQWIALQREHWLISTFLTRTIMDRRYFHGIRTEAAAVLPKCAKDELSWIGLFHLHKIFQELFCSPKSAVTRPNDFSDRAIYLVQCAIPKAISKIKDNAGRAPVGVRRFFLDQLKFNDNSVNPVSDSFYIATLLSCLAETLSSPPKQGQWGTDDEEEEESFQREAISEIERYRRIDEWISSYQNVFSVAALDCILRLAKSNVLQPKLADFMHYTRVGNGEVLRLQAFRCLVDLGGFEHGAVMKYVLHTLSNDPSPYVRHNVWRIFGGGLGKVAIGEEKPDPNMQASDGLIIEQEVSTETRQADFARKHTTDGALTALRKEIGKNALLKQGLWAAITSPRVSFAEMSRLLDLCTVLYDEIDSLLVELKYPRYWNCRNLGQGKVSFWKTNRFREKKAPPREPEPPPRSTPTTAGPPKIKLTKTAQPKLERKQSTASFSSQTSVRPSPIPPAPSPPVSAPPLAVQGNGAKGAMAPPQSKRPQKIVKLKVKGLARLTRETPVVKAESPGPLPDVRGTPGLTSIGESKGSGQSSVPRLKLSTPSTRLTESIPPHPAKSPTSGISEGLSSYHGGIQSGRPSSAASARSSPSNVSVAAKSTGSGGKKRKSGTSATPTPQSVQGDANGLVGEADTANKKRKTSANATPTPQPGAGDANGPVSNSDSGSKKRKSSASLTPATQSAAGDAAAPSSTAAPDPDASAPLPSPDASGGEPPHKRIKLKLNFGQLKNRTA